MVILRLFQNQKAKTLNIFHAVTGMFSVLARDKVSLLTAYNSPPKYDKFFISETYVHSSFDKNTYSQIRWLN